MRKVLSSIILFDVLLSFSLFGLLSDSDIASNGVGVGEKTGSFASKVVHLSLPLFLREREFEKRSTILGSFRVKN